MELKTSLSNGVYEIILNRPEVFNSFNQSMAFSLQKELDFCATNNDIRVVVISGAGKAFCAGQDLAEATDPNGPELNCIVKEHYNPIILKIRNLEKPVIAAVNGVAAGAGANIALACDITIAHEKASFIQAFSKIGLIPDSGGTYFLPRIIGTQKALSLMITGDKVSAKEAEGLNMIYKCLEADAYEAEVSRLAIHLSEMPTKAFGLTKKAINKSYSNSLEEQLELEEKLQTQAGNTDDFKEGVQAFLEKRKAKFTGK
jgi:2-(1,2-epoxy-1,2-dihydrophenyl)acetyl-CoA isomerase